MTTPTHPSELTPRVTDEHRRLASDLLAGSTTEWSAPFRAPLGREDLALAIAAAEQRGAAKLAATITLHAKEADEAAAIYRDHARSARSKQERAASAVLAGQANAVVQALRGVLSA